MSRGKWIQTFTIIELSLALLIGSNPALAKVHRHCSVAFAHANYIDRRYALRRLCDLRNPYEYQRIQCYLLEGLGK